MALICGIWTQSSRHHMETGRSQVRPLPSPALGYPLQWWEESSGPTGIPESCAAPALGPAKCLKWIAKDLLLICLQMFVQAYTLTSREATAPASSGELSHGVKCSDKWHQKWALCTKPIISAPLWQQPPWRPPVVCLGWQQLLEVTAWTKHHRSGS